MMAPVNKPRVALAFFTRQGEELARKVGEILQRPGVWPLPVSEVPETVYFDKRVQSARAWVEREFHASALVFVGAAGIAVRLLDGLMRGKDKDPAVLVLDERGEYVIPLLSGHIGGANRLAKALARELGARAVITTATDVNGVFAVDEWATGNGLAVHNVDMIKPVSAAFLRGDIVGLVSDFLLCGPLPRQLERRAAGPLGIRVSMSASTGPFAQTLTLIPRIAVLGAGCRKEIAPERFERAALAFLERHDISPQALRALASLDIKRNEACMIAFAAKHGLDFQVFSAGELAEIPGEFSASSFVQSRTGVDNVCERAAVKAGGERLIIRKTVADGITFALAAPPWQCTFDQE